MKNQDETIFGDFFLYFLKNGNFWVLKNCIKHNFLKLLSDPLNVAILGWHFWRQLMLCIVYTASTTYYFGGLIYWPSKLGLKSEKLYILKNVGWYLNLEAYISSLPYQIWLKLSILQFLSIDSSQKKFQLTMTTISGSNKSFK